MGSEFFCRLFCILEHHLHAAQPVSYPHLFHSDILYQLPESLQMLIFPHLLLEVDTIRTFFALDISILLFAPSDIVC